LSIIRDKRQSIHLMILLAVAQTKSYEEKLT
jgi:hypothetical protein